MLDCMNVQGIFCPKQNHTAFDDSDPDIILFICTNVCIAFFFILVSDMDQSIFNIKRGMTLTDPFVKLYPPQSTILPLKSCVLV